MNLFVTGTDTGIGKTVVSALLALKFDLKYWKPIQSGLSAPTDSDFVASIIGDDRIHKEVYRLKNPLSPHTAAEIEGVEIDPHDILRAAPHKPSVIEGCGGLLVPLNSHDFIIDLIGQLDCPVVLVARSSLGTINHTLLSIEALKVRSLKLLGVILVGEKNPANRKSIEKFGRVQVLGEIPFLPSLSRNELLSATNNIELENLWK
jgi:dethiobiotin synthase